MKTTTRIWTATEIKTLLTTRPVFVERSILKLHERQTADERATKSTNHRNNIGFNGADAPGMSFVADFLKKGGHLTSAKALGKYGPRLVKYIGQLVQIANTEGKKTTTDHINTYREEHESGVVRDDDDGCKYCGDPEFHDGEPCHLEAHCQAC